MPQPPARGQADRLPIIVLATVLALGLAGACRAADPVADSDAVLHRAMARSAATPKPPRLDRATLLQGPRIVDVRLSPDGRRLSIIEEDGAGSDLLLQDVASGKRRRIVNDARELSVAWSGDGARLWLSDADGLAVLEGDGPSARRIFHWDARRGQELWRVDAAAPGHVVVHETLVRGDARRHRYLAVDADGQARLLQETAQPLHGVLLDAKGRLAFTAGFEGPRFDTVIRRHGADGARELMRCTDIAGCALAGASASADTLWVLAPEAGNLSVLRRWRADADRWETVHRDPAGNADSDGVLWSASRHDWLAVSYHGDRRRWHGQDAATRAVLATLERQLPDANLRFSVSADQGLWLVRAQRADWRLPRHFLFRVASGRLQPLFESETRAAKSERLAAMQGFRYRGRDGGLRQGYVMLPAGVPLAKAPLVAWLHGGPVDRIQDVFDRHVQLLVNRGYAVFVPNFRGSTGFGLDYVRALQGDVGNGRMLADVLDGLDHLLRLGIGDAGKQAVMGHSFGGYASLLAGVHAPARFRFALAAAAASDYGWIKQWQADHDAAAGQGEPPLALQFAWHRMDFEDADWRRKMRRESPLAQVGKLEAPVYLWAGGRDERVPLQSVVHFATEARRQGKPLALLIDPEAGHVPQAALAREAYLFLVEVSAHRHFGGGVEPPSPELRAYLMRHLRVDDRLVRLDADDLR